MEQNHIYRRREKLIKNIWKTSTTKKLEKLDRAITLYIKRTVIKEAKPNKAYMKTCHFTQVTNRVLYWHKFLQFQQGQQITSNSLAIACTVGNIKLSLSISFRKAKKQLSLEYRELQQTKYNNKVDQKNQELDIIQQESIRILAISLEAKKS